MLVCSRGEILVKKFKHDLCDLKIFKFQRLACLANGSVAMGMVLVVAAMLVGAVISRSVNKM